MNENQDQKEGSEIQMLFEINYFREQLKTAMPVHSPHITRTRVGLTIFCGTTGDNGNAVQNLGLRGADGHYKLTFCMSPHCTLPPQETYM